MFQHSRCSGFGLVVVGVLLVLGGAFHHYQGCQRHGEFEKHIADTCLKAAEAAKK